MIAHTLACLGRHGFHRLAYYEWAGPSGAPTVLCLHGLTRNGHDFDVLAEALSAEFRIVALDFPGRGASEWLSHPEDYVTETYAADTAAVIARLGVERVDLYLAHAWDDDVPAAELAGVFAELVEAGKIGERIEPKMR